MNIAENLKRIKTEIGENVKLIAVSKYTSNDEVIDAYNVGQRDFGENKVQDLEDKREKLPKEIRWHFIGHLQRNKVKFIAPYIHMIHAVDSFRLLREINKHAKAAGRVIPCLLQLKIAEEDTKFGMTEEEILAIIENPELRDLQNIEIKGLMGMATLTEDRYVLHEEFEKVKLLFNKIKQLPRLRNVVMKEMSMGMSNDYPIAIENGSTMVRLGSSVFKS